MEYKRLKLKNIMDYDIKFTSHGIFASLCGDFYQNLYYDLEFQFYLSY